MGDTILQAVSALSFTYIFSVVLFTYFLISTFFKKSKLEIKQLITFIVGLVLALVWYFVIKTELDALIPSFAVAVVLYDFVIKAILKAFKVTYSQQLEREEEAHE